jgi:hypothetical protein
MCSDRSQGWPDFKGQRPVLRWAAAGFRVFVLTAGAPLPGIQACAYLLRCGIQPRPAGRIAWQGKSFRSLPIPVKYMRFAMTARFFGSAERLGTMCRPSLRAIRETRQSRNRSPALST